MTVVDSAFLQHFDVQAGLFVRATFSTNIFLSFFCVLSVKHPAYYGFDVSTLLLV